jgi:hypothetical protein
MPGVHVRSAELLPRALTLSEVQEWSSTGVAPPPPVKPVSPANSPRAAAAAPAALDLKEVKLDIAPASNSGSPTAPAAGAAAPNPLSRGASFRTASIDANGAPAALTILDAPVASIATTASAADPTDVQSPRLTAASVKALGEAAKVPVQTKPAASAVPGGDDSSGKRKAPALKAAKGFNVNSKSAPAAPEPVPLTPSSPNAALSVLVAASVAAPILDRLESNAAAEAAAKAAKAARNLLAHDFNDPALHQRSLIAAVTNHALHLPPNVEVVAATSHAAAAAQSKSWRSSVASYRVENRIHHLRLGTGSYLKLTAVHEWVPPNQALPNTLFSRVNNFTLIMVVKVRLTCSTSALRCHFSHCLSILVRESSKGVFVAVQCRRRALHADSDGSPLRRHRCRQPVFWFSALESVAAHCDCGRQQTLRLHGVLH